MERHFPALLLKESRDENKNDIRLFEFAEILPPT